MKLFKAMTIVCCMALMGAIFTPNATAAAWNRKTVVTFSGPVEIPGVHLTGFSVLPAGTYVFKIVDSQSDRHIVQIFSKDQKKIYATILAIPNYRLKPTDKTVITFMERPAGQPQALRAWFYPGRHWGEEFVYPKAKALEMAKTSSTPILYSPAEIPVETAEPIISADAPADAPVVTELRRAPIMAVKPSGEEVQLAEVSTPPPAEEAQVAAAQAPERESLPGTASPLPLIGLFGLLTLGGAFAVRSFAGRL